ncbi:uncharacterized protein LOC132760644 [Ruditapes philippinarum]|uniref:uncharacterized protein LOC132760644 n=1 Tax=Ruditapes philippinarum TaxID=129788 RepID=UPI00295BA38A|nr:uncharacterized protein LOC132760644 [Ruditapes philippinarum]
MEFDEEEWRRKFDNYDMNKDGVISGEEITRLMQYVGFNPTKADEEDFLQRLGKSKCKEEEIITFEEFFELVKTLPDPSGELYVAFKCFDKDDSGYIDKEELKEILTSGYMDPNDIDEIFALVDDDKNGKIEFKEFITLFK